MNKKVIWSVIIIIVVVILIIAGTHKQAQAPQGQNQQGKVFTVGSVLALTGTSAIWGETVKNGMELALANKPEIKMLYEDSRSTAPDGISAFNRLQEQHVDLTVSELSFVSVPLAKLALERKVPLFVTLSATSPKAVVNDYTVRYYVDPKHYSGPAFFSTTSPAYAAKKIAVLYRNDELGAAVKDEITKIAADRSKDIVYIEAYKPNETDFSTMITKVKNSKAEVFVFVVSTPGEAVAVVKTGSRLGLTIPMVEASGVFADMTNRKEVEGIPYYSTSFDFSLNTPETNAFKNAYKTAYGKEPGFGAAFGYDVANLIYQCRTETDVLACVRAVKQNKGMAGTAEQVGPGDFSVTMHVEKVN
ncbi:MAG TPA: ABC transporter substrate-binding protein [Candidatus Paceibacterota bacterium]